MLNWKTNTVMSLRIFVAFFRMGPLTFGGGYAMMPAIEREIIKKRGWLTQDDLGNLISIAGSAPGGVAINAAAFIGYRVGGIPGAVAAVVGITMPTFLIVCLLSLFYAQFQDNAKVVAAFKGIHGAIVAFIIAAAYRMAKAAWLDIPTKLASAAAFALLMFTSIYQPLLILGGIVAGIVIVLAKEKLGFKARTEQPTSAESQQAPVYPEYYI